MRVNVKKHLILGPWSQREIFFQKAQELGVVEFISKEPKPLEAPHEIQLFVDALHILRQMPPVEELPATEFHSANVLARHIVERQHELEHLREQVRVLQNDISRIDVFGDFSLDTVRQIETETHRVIQFFFAKANQELPAKNRPEVIYVGSQYGLDYFVSINRERTSYEGLIEIIIDRSLGELQEKLADVHKSIDEYETELARLTHYKKFLKNELIRALNTSHLEEAQERVRPLLDGDVFAVETWIPKNKIALIKKLADELDLYMEKIAVEKEDKIPTYLENKGISRLGEDLINIYDTPSHSDRDPSTWVFISFALFFSMIVADAGYGLILLGISLYLFYKFRKKGGLGKRVIKLSMYLSIGCIIWGVFTASFLGIEFPIGGTVKKFSLINWMVEQKAAYFLEKKPPSYEHLIKEYPEAAKAKTPNELLTSVIRKEDTGESYVIYNNFQGNVLIEIVIFIGTIHIMLSFLRYVDKNWSAIGWITFMVGAYLFFPSILGAVSLIHYIFHIPYEFGTMIGKYILFSGLGLVVILAIAQKKLAGVGEVMHVIGVFADVMSYLRIYALSLAGMIMAATFNRIGTSIPIYIGIFIILAGHAVNITLALMGGVIHGLRLNFIEWYHYSFEGGGKKFNPLKLIKSD